MKPRPVWQIGNCDDCGVSLYAHESEINGRSIPVNGERCHACSSRKLGTSAAAIIARSQPVTLPTEANQKLRKATNQAKHEANKQRESEVKELLTSQLAKLGIMEPEWEHKFAWPRGWRFDGAIFTSYPGMPKVVGIAIEIEGRGRHTQTWKNKKADGTKEKLTPFEKDCEKYNTAAILGWRVLRFTYAMIRSGEAARTIQDALK